LAQVVLTRRATVDSRVSPKTEISVKGTDISARDNAALATAANMIVVAFANLRGRGLIDDAELLRLAYRFAGEVTDVEDMLRRGQVAPPVPPEQPGSAPRTSHPGSTLPPAQPSNNPPNIKVNPIKINPGTGEPTNAE